MNVSMFIIVFLIIFVGALNANKKFLKTRQDFWEFAIFLPFCLSLFLAALHCLEGKKFFDTFFHILILCGIFVGSFIATMGIRNIKFTDLIKSPT